MRDPKQNTNTNITKAASTADVHIPANKIDEPVLAIVDRRKQIIQFLAIPEIPQQAWNFAIACRACPTTWLIIWPNNAPIDIQRYTKNRDQQKTDSPFSEAPTSNCHISVKSRLQNLVQKKVVQQSLPGFASPGFCFPPFVVLFLSNSS